MAITAKRKAAGPSTTTLGISGLGAKQEDIERAIAAGMDVKRVPKRLRLLLYGPFKSAKTITAHNLPRTRTLDFDDGMQSVEWAIRKGIIQKDLNEIVYKTILRDPNDPKSTRVIDIAADTVDEWLADEDIPPEEWDRPYPQFWDTLIIDSGSFLNESAKMLALKENKRLELSKSLDKVSDKKISVVPMRQQDWGSAGSLFRQAIENWRAIGKNIVLICHEYTETDDNTETVTGIKPLLIGQLRDNLPAAFDEVWYMYTKGPRTNPEYMIQTVPDNLHRLGSRIGCLDNVISADFKKIRKTISDFYGVAEESIWKAYHGTEGAKQAAAEEVRESSTV